MLFVRIYFTFIEYNIIKVVNKKVSREGRKLNSYPYPYPAHVFRDVDFTVLDSKPNTEKRFSKNE